jgi:hypothetical protein
MELQPKIASPLMELQTRLPPIPFQDHSLLNQLQFLDPLLLQPVLSLKMLRTKLDISTF